jgi:hypothetical protein
MVIYLNDTIAVISKILPVAFLIILGNLLHKFKFLKQGTIDELKKIIVNISLPALLFMAFAETNFESHYILIFLSVFITCGLMLLLGIFLKIFLKFNNKYLPTVFSGFETGMMGYSLFVAVYGTTNMYKLAVIDLGQVFFVFFVLVSYLQKLNGKSATIKQLLLSFIKSPVIIAIISGILVGSLGVTGAIKGFSVSNSILEMLKLLSNLTVPTICIVIGYELHIDLENMRKPFLTALTRLIILMLLAFFINTFLIEGVLHLDNIFKIALYTMFLLPPPFVIPIFMKDKEERNKQFILNTISINIILSLVAFVILILVMK